MTVALALTLFELLAGAPAKTRPAPPPGEGASYASKDRVEYLTHALEALRDAKPGTLAQGYQYASAMERSACGSPVERLRAECLTTAARKYCRGRKPEEARGCSLYMDIIVSNVLAEKQLVPMEERYELMRRYKDHRKELDRRLRQLQGSLAADFQLATRPEPNPASLAPAIDRWCLQTSDETNLSWQTCASSLAWFIGSAP